MPRQMMHIWLVSVINILPRNVAIAHNGANNFGIENTLVYYCFTSSLRLPATGDRTVIHGSKMVVWLLLPSLYRLLTISHMLHLHMPFIIMAFVIARRY